MIFEDWHLMLVLGVFILVHCAKPLCERCVELEERILACFHMASALSCVRFVMLWLCMLQPFLLCSAYLYKRAHNAPSQLVLLTRIKTNPELLLNETLEFGRNSSHDALSAVAVTLSWRTLDYMFFVVPLALTLCWSTMLWMQLSHTHVLHEGQSWDSDVVESVRTYEAVYLLELLALNLACIGVTSHGRTSIEIFYLCMALTLLMVHCLSSAFVERDGKAEAWATCAYFVVLGALMRNWWIEMLQAACAGTVLIAIAHTTAVTAICWVHATGNGQRLASTIIAVRTFASLGVCLVLLCVYVAGWEASC